MTQALVHACRFQIFVLRLSCSLILFESTCLVNISALFESPLTPFTFISTVTSIIVSGAKPVFVDINEEDHLINADLIEAAITPKTKAIMPVHLFGQVCEMDKINKIAKKHNLVVIEDTSQSFGAEQNGKLAGMLSDLGTFSFQKTNYII